MKVSALITGTSLVAVGVHAQAHRSPVVTSNGTLVSIFIFHNHCDRTSLFQADGTRGGIFGSLGATMCFQDGAYYWNKYLKRDGPLKIHGTSQIYNPEHVIAEVPDVEMSVQSAMAFMQGLYKPIDLQSSVTSGPGLLAADNSTFVNGPLQGYQYVPITTYRSQDPSSIWISDYAQQCKNQMTSSQLYYGDDEFDTIKEESLPFYDRLYEPYFEGVFEKYRVNFFYAYVLFDYVSQNRAAGNATLLAMPEEDFDQLHAYASHLEFNLYANTATSTNLNWANGDLSKDLRDVGGRMLARKIALTFRDFVTPDGPPSKVNFLLGNYDIMLSFFAIANLPSKNPDFFGLPDLGSSMVFELYSEEETIESDGIGSGPFRVAFGFRNGTTVDDTLTYFPLFDQDPQTDSPSMPLDTFLEKMDQVAVRDQGQWCSICNSAVDFCKDPGPVNSPSGPNRGGQDGNADGDRDGQRSENGDHGMAPAVAGVIGAAIMLVLVGIVAALAFFIFGVGVKRDRRRGSIFGSIGTIGRSQPKEKLESEIELPLSPTGAPMPRGFGEDNEHDYGTTSTVATKVASPLASPKEAHFKAWESRL